MSDSARDDAACQDLIVQSPLPKILPIGGISMLAGAPNVGKTALIAGLLRDLRDGRQIFGRPTTPPTAIGYINADRSWAQGSGIWFERAGFADIRQYSMTDDESFSPKRLRKKHERTDILISFIDKLGLPAYAIVCVDPVALFLGGNLLDYDSCAVACLELRKYLRDKQYIMLATAHSAKIKADKRERYMRLQDQVLGSTAISGFTDTMMYLASPQETGKPYFSLIWHPHSAPAETFQLEQDHQGLFQSYGGVDGGSQTRVLALFPEDGSIIPLQVLCELAERYPLSKATVKRALDALLETEKVAKVAHGLYSLVLVH